MNDKHADIPELLIAARRYLVAATTVLLAYTLIDLEIATTAEIPGTNVSVTLKNPSSILYLLQFIVLYALYRFAIEAAEASSVLARSAIRRVDTYSTVVFAWAGLAITTLHEKMFTGQPSSVRSNAIDAGFLLSVVVILAVLSFSRSRRQLSKRARAVTLAFLFFTATSITVVLVVNVRVRNAHRFDYAASMITAALIFWAPPAAFFWLRDRLRPPSAATMPQHIADTKGGANPDL